MDRNELAGLAMQALLPIAFNESSLLRAQADKLRSKLGMPEGHYLVVDDLSIICVGVADSMIAALNGEQKPYAANTGHKVEEEGESNG